MAFECTALEESDGAVARRNGFREAHERMMTIESLAQYLGQDVEEVLHNEPFCSWPYERSVDSDLEETIINYVFFSDGVDIQCDQNDRVATIFLFCDDLRHFSDSVAELPFSMTQDDVLARFGKPAKAGRPLNDPILGAFGGWHLYRESSYALHIEYSVRGDGISKITFMRLDVVP